MPFLRVTRDQRGYETTFLLHASHPGERPRVLYWYRTAPAVRVGRPAFDEDAIRAIEEQHPDIEFDWVHMLEAAAAMAPEPDTRFDRGPVRGGRGGDQERRRKPASRPREQAYPSAAPPAVASFPPERVVMHASTDDEPRREAPLIDTQSAERDDVGRPSAAALPTRASDVLAELVGREIAARLRSRYQDIADRIDQQPDADPAKRAAWKARAAALDPDSWTTPEEILRGVQQADRLFDELRRDMGVRS